jgi:hypothetical protein
VNGGDALGEVGALGLGEGEAVPNFVEGHDE